MKTKTVKVKTVQTEKKILDEILDAVYEAQSDRDIWSALRIKEEGDNVYLVFNDKRVATRPKSYYKKRGTLWDKIPYG